MGSSLVLDRRWVCLCVSVFEVNAGVACVDALRSGPLLISILKDGQYGARYFGNSLLVVEPNGLARLPFQICAREESERRFLRSHRISIGCVLRGVLFLLWGLNFKRN